jgi:hypothetical protein
MTLPEQMELMDYLIKHVPEATVQDLTDAIREREAMEKEVELDQKILRISPKHLKQAK